MSDVSTALITAGTALVASGITGWFARSAGGRQAEAARHAGDRQADAALETLRATLQEQRTVRMLDQRRQAYVRFLDAAETVLLTRSTGEGGSDDRPALQRALGGVLLAGPDEAARAAGALAEGLRAGRSPDELDDARRAFVASARAALDGPGGRPEEG